MVIRKASFSGSPLATPYSPIHRLAARLQDHLHFPDPYPLYILAASLVANYAPGRPVWLMLIGPPSCGKTELLNSLLSLPGTVEGGAISGVGALLSGSRRKERHESSTGGLMRQIGDRGTLVLKEFTSILSLQHETLRSLLGAFREIYDGRWTRQVGTDGGTFERWEGKMALLTGCTESIDHHHALIADMGERFIFYRYEASDGWSEAFKALSSPASDLLSRRLQELVLEFADDIGLDWETPALLPELDTHDKQRVIAFSQIAAHGRSAVIRDPYTREIVQASTGEYPIRIAIVFSQILRALRFIGVDEDDNWRLIRKIAFDSIPGNRRHALFAIFRGGETTGQIADQMRVSLNTTRRALEELRIHRVVEREEEHWQLSSWTMERLTEAMNGSGMNPVAEKSYAAH